MLISDTNTQTGVCSYINTTGDMKSSWSHQASSAVSGCHPYKATVKEEMAEGVMPMKCEKPNRKQ